MRLDQPWKLLDRLRFDGCLHRTISGRIVRRLVPVTETDEHSHAIGIERQDRISTTEEQDLLGPWITDRREALECFLGLRERKFENRLEVAPKFFKGDLRGATELFGTLLGYDSANPRLDQSSRRCRQNLFRRHPDLLAQLRHGLLPPLVVDQIRNVLPDNQGPGIGMFRCRGLSVVGLEPVDQLSESSHRDLTRSPVEVMIREVHERVPIVGGDVVLAGPDVIADRALRELAGCRRGHRRPRPIRRCPAACRPERPPGPPGIHPWGRPRGLPRPSRSAPAGARSRRSARAGRPGRRSSWPLYW